MYTLSWSHRLRDQVFRQETSWALATTGQEKGVSPIQFQHTSMLAAMPIGASIASGK